VGPPGSARSSWTRRERSACALVLTVSAHIAAGASGCPDAGRWAGPWGTVTMPGRTKDAVEWASGEKVDLATEAAVPLQAESPLACWVSLGRCEGGTIRLLRSAGAGSNGCAGAEKQGSRRSYKQQAAAGRLCRWRRGRLFGVGTQKDG